MPGAVVVATFHTHPNPGAEGYGSRSRAEDTQSAWLFGVPCLIRADDGIHTTGPASRRGRLTGAPVISPDQIASLAGEKKMGNSVVGLAGDQALAIAQADAARVYRDLSLYRIQLVLDDDGWHVDYELKNPRLKGGGPHYIIDGQTGAVISKRYEQ